MPIRLACKRIFPSVGGLLYSHYGPAGHYRPILDVFLVSPSGQYAVEPAQIDTASDFTVFGSGVALSLGLTLPFPRQAGISGALGTQALTVSFPPEGLVSLFITDYRDYYYLPAPLIGFHSPSPAAASQRSVLGEAGFLQYFRFVLDPAPTPHVFELDHPPVFPGQMGGFPRGRSLADIIRGLRRA